MRASKLVAAVILSGIGVAIVTQLAYSSFAVNIERARVEKECPIGYWVSDFTAGSKEVYVCESATMAISSPSVSRRERHRDLVSDQDQQFIAKLGALPVEPAPPPPKVHASPSFGGYACKSDCSGHRAGYAWAEDNDIGYYEDCEGNSRSFVQGCYVWVEELESADDENN